MPDWGARFTLRDTIAKLLEALRPQDGRPPLREVPDHSVCIDLRGCNYLLALEANSGIHEEVKKLDTHKAYKPVAALARPTSFRYGEDELFPCVYRDAKTPRNSIPFRDKVDCACRLGLVDEAYAGDIKRIYELRNLTQIETEAERQMEIELAQARTAYWRMQPFLSGIAEALAETP